MRPRAGANQGAARRPRLDQGAARRPRCDQERLDRRSVGLRSRPACRTLQRDVRASRDGDGKNAFALSGRGIRTRLILNSRSGRLVDTNVSAEDKAAHVCPVGVILPKRRGFAIPLGQSVFDLKPISARADSTEAIATAEAEE